MVPLDRLAYIGDKAVIPFGIVVFIVYACMEIVHVMDRVQASETAITSLSADQKEYIKAVQSIDKRLYRLEDKLEVGHPDDDEK